MILATVATKDVPNLRLTCKTLAKIGFDYLIPEAELLFTRKSFDRLHEISQHPVLSPRVTSLFYCLDSLSQHFDKREYTRGVAKSLSMRSYDSGLDDWVGPPPSRGASDRQHRMYTRNVARGADPDSRYSKRELTRGWEAYKQLYAEQDLLRNASYGTEEIVAMVARLPNLKNITISNFNEAFKTNHYFEKTYKPTLLRTSGDDGFPENSGEPQLFSVIRALHQARTTLETFEADMVSWHILEAAGEIFEMIGIVLGSLKELKLCFYTSQSYEWHHPDDNDDSIEEDAECAQALGRGRHHDLLRSMPYLQVVDISIQSPLILFDFVSIFGEVYWPHLRDISINLLMGTDDVLLRFLKRHAATLQCLKLFNFNLTKGLWCDVFRQMRALLNLKNFDTRGILTTESCPGDVWDMTKFRTDGGDQPISVRDELISYMLRRGSEPSKFRYAGNFYH
ncbi:MAG: hypothetical protein LQ352_000721 [Teloschistes flavicans]|nr:MAG: hypothetical protein LQ352_000721 [Teloschistes flavicans]